VERSGTLGISYQLRSALKERQRLPAKKRRLSLSHSPALSELYVFILYSYPGFRCASPWAEFFNRFAVSPTAQSEAVGLKCRLRQSS